MEILTKIIIIHDENLKNHIYERLWLQTIEKTSVFEIWSIYKQDENILLYSVNNQNDYLPAIQHAKQNYTIFKIIEISKAQILSGSDLQNGDVIIPNTFSNTLWEVFFSEYVIDKNYNLKNFWLQLNGLCLSVSKKELSEEILAAFENEYMWDIFDFSSFDFMKICYKNEINDKGICIKYIDENDDKIQNVIDILELVL